MTDAVKDPASNDFSTVDAAEDSKSGAGIDESGRKTALETLQELSIPKQESADKTASAP